MQYLITYDIHSTKRRARVLGVLRNYGFLVQRSVAECELDAARVRIVQDKLAAVINKRQDQVRFYPLCQACYLRSEVLGRYPVPVSGSLGLDKPKPGIE